MAIFVKNLNNMKKLYTLIAFMAIFTFAQAQPGMLDPTFGEGGIVTTSLFTGYNFAETIAVQTDGKIIVSGNVGMTNMYDVGVARYNEDGSLDITFGLGGMVVVEASNFADYIYAISIQSDGKILLAGRTWDGNKNSTLVIRLLPNGDLDNSFATGGIFKAGFNGVSSYPGAMAIQEDGKILLGGSHDDNFSIVRLNANGTFDNTFGVDGLVKLVIGIPSMQEIRDMVIQRDGKIVVAGLAFNDFIDRGFGVARFNTDGSLDTGFAGQGYRTLNVGSGNDFALGVGLQRNDKIVISGHSWKGNNPLQHDFAVARLNVDGSLDLTFGNDGSVTTNIVYGNNYAEGGLVIQPDDKIVLAGWVFGANATHTDAAVVRYLPDGALDMGFGTNGYTTTDIAVDDDKAKSVALQADGKIVIGGHTWGAAGSMFLVARYNNDFVGIAQKEIVEFNVFPNPTQNQLTIELTNSSIDYQLDIIDLTGRSVYSTTLKQSGNIDVSALARGAYFVRLNSATETGVTRFIKD